MNWVNQVVLDKQAKEDFERIMTEEIRNRMVGKIKKAGYLYVSLDLEGYIQGSMNR